MPPRISKQDFENWWTSPVGVEFRKMLKENLDKLAYGNMTSSYARDQISNAIEIGRFQVTMEYYNLRYEDIAGKE